MKFPTIRFPAKAVVCGAFTLSALTGFANQTILLQGFQQWIAEEFDGESIEASLLLKNADPDHDGLTNLLEYGLDSDPLHSSEEDLPGAKMVGDTLQYDYTADQSKSDITYAIQSSKDLKLWTDIPTETVTAKGSLQRRRATIPMQGTTPIFVRLVVRPAGLD